MSNEAFIYVHLRNNNIKVENYEYPLDYSDGRNGLIRFNKSFIVESDKTQTSDIVFNENEIDVRISRKKRWGLF